MEMDKMGVVTTFIHNIVVYNIPLLYGTAGEIMVEKSGSLNLGVEGIMAVGAIFGYIVGCYANSLGVGILMAFLMGALCGLLFAVLTVSLQANQNITGLTLTTFGLGVYFFVGNGVKAISWPVMNDYANIKEGFANLPIPGLSQIPVLGEGLFNHNVLVYLCVVIALVMWWYLNRTNPGLRLRAAKQVHREMPFNTLAPTDWALTDAEKRGASGEILVQGAIDCCFLEDGQWVLLDYKTSRAENLEEIRAFYARQLELYAYALKRITGVPVKDRILCLISMGMELHL